LWVSVVLGPGVLAGRMVVDAPPEFEKRLYLAYPTLPQDRKEWAIRELSRLMQAHNLQQKHLHAVLGDVRFLGTRFLGTYISL
jgi:hypothetical protein